MYVYVDEYVFIYILTHAYIYIHTHKRYMDTYWDICTSTWTHIHTFKLEFTHTHSDTHIVRLLRYCFRKFRKNTRITQIPEALVWESLSSRQSLHGILMYSSSPLSPSLTVASFSICFPSPCVLEHTSPRQSLLNESIVFPDRSFEWQQLRLHTWTLVWIFGDSRANMFDMYGDLRENLLEILAVVIISSPITSVRGYVEGMVAESPKKKEKIYLNCTSSKSPLHGPILLLSVITSDQL